MDATELLKALAGLSPEQKAAAQAILGGAAPPTETPKFSRALDQVTDDEVEKIVDACLKGLAHAAAHPDREHEAIQFLQQVAPVVASAAQTNSAYRRKPITHSLQVCADYLCSAESEERRKHAARARRRRTTTTTTPAPASAPAASETGKGK